MPPLQAVAEKSQSQFVWTHHETGEAVAADPQRAAVMAQFLDAKRENNLSKDTLRCYHLAIRNFEQFLCHWAGADRGLIYDGLTRNNITDFLKFLREERGFQPSTINLTLIGVKQFLRFGLTGKMSGPIPEFISDVTVKVRKTDPTNKRISEQEFEQMLEASAPCPWFQAFIAVAYDTGCRRGEIFTCKIKSFERDKYGGLLHVRGKTGERTVRLAYSCRFVIEQVNRLPSAEEGWLFPAPTNPEKHVSGGLLAHKFNRIREKLGYKRDENGKWPITMHTFRHNRATIVAEKGWNEQLMREHFGWSKGSDMPSHYTHVNRGALDAAIFKSQGMSNLIVPEEEEFGIETTWDCRMCSEFNPMHHNFCGKCGQARSRGVAMTYDNILETIEKKVAGQIAEKALNEILADKELQELGNALQPDEALKEELGLS